MGDVSAVFFGAPVLKTRNDFAVVDLLPHTLHHIWQNQKQITDYLCNEILAPCTMLIANITPALEFDTPVRFFEVLKRLLGYKKHRTIAKIDNIQRDLCEYKQYNTFCDYVDRIDQHTTAVVN